MERRPGQNLPSGARGSKNRRSPSKEGHDISCPTQKSKLVRVAREVCGADGEKGGGGFKDLGRLGDEATQSRRCEDELHSSVNVIGVFSIAFKPCCNRASWKGKLFSFKYLPDERKT